MLELGRQLASPPALINPSANPPSWRSSPPTMAWRPAVVGATFRKSASARWLCNYLQGERPSTCSPVGSERQCGVVDLGVASLPRAWSATRNWNLIRVAGWNQELPRLAPAMSRDEAFRAVLIGIRLAEQWTGRDGGSASSPWERWGSATPRPPRLLLAGLTQWPVDRVVGRGTGLDDAGLSRGSVR